MTLGGGEGRIDWFVGDRRFSQTGVFLGEAFEEKRCERGIRSDGNGAGRSRAECRAAAECLAEEGGVDPVCDRANEAGDGGDGGD